MNDWKPGNEQGNAQFGNAGGASGGAAQGGSSHEMNRDFGPQSGAGIPPFTHYPPPPSYPPTYSPVKRKSKWAAALLSFLFPGLGHFYTGAMQRGLFFMLLFVANIVGIVFFAESNIVPIIVLLGVMVPVVFFYSLFDALQTVDRINQGQFPYPPGFGVGDPFAPVPGSAYRRSIGPGHIGILLVAIGVLIFLATNKPIWLERLIHSTGSIFGAAILIGVGAYLFITESKKNK
jgi:TM2 domain-containing membrane protein YozV